MERLLTSADIADRLQVKPRTAVKYMRQMEHLETPLRVTEAALAAWIASNTVHPGQTVRQVVEQGRRNRKAPLPVPGRIPRRRESA